MAKKKIVKLTDEEYYAYIMGLRNNAAAFTPDGKVIVPPPFDKENEDEKKSEKD